MKTIRLTMAVAGQPIVIPVHGIAFVHQTHANAITVELFNRSELIVSESVDDIQRMIENS